MNCSTLRERTAGSPPSTSQVSLPRWCPVIERRLSIFTTKAMSYIGQGMSACARVHMCILCAPYVCVGARAQKLDGQQRSALPQTPLFACVLKQEFWQAIATGEKAPHGQQLRSHEYWAEAHEKIARMTLTIKLDRNWSSFQLANRAPPLSVTDSSIAPSARMLGSALRQAKARRCS